VVPGSFLENNGVTEQRIPATQKSHT